MDMHISYSVRDDCYNLEDSYGEICVHCNCCGRVDKATMWYARLGTNERHLRENAEFDNWSDDPEQRALQERNVAANVVWLQKRIDECRAEILKQHKKTYEAEA